MFCLNDISNDSYSYSYTRGAVTSPNCRWYYQ